MVEGVDSLDDEMLPECDAADKGRGKEVTDGSCRIELED